MLVRLDKTPLLPIAAVARYVGLRMVHVPWDDRCNLVVGEEVSVEAPRMDLLIDLLMDILEKLRPRSTVTIRPMIDRVLPVALLIETADPHPTTVSRWLILRHSSITPLPSNTIVAIYVRQGLRENGARRARNQRPRPTATPSSSLTKS